MISKWKLHRFKLEHALKPYGNVLSAYWDKPPAEEPLPAITMRSDRVRWKLKFPPEIGYVWTIRIFHDLDAHPSNIEHPAVDALKNAKIGKVLRSQTITSFGKTSETIIEIMM